MNIKSFALVALVFSVGCVSHTTPFHPEGKGYDRAVALCNKGDSESCSLVRTVKSHELVAAALTTCGGVPVEPKNVCKYTRPETGGSNVTCDLSQNITGVVLTACKSWDFSTVFTNADNLKQLRFLSAFGGEAATAAPYNLIPHDSIHTLCAQNTKVSVEGKDLCTPAYSTDQARSIVPYMTRQPFTQFYSVNDDASQRLQFGYTKLEWERANAKTGVEALNEKATAENDIALLCSNNYLPACTWLQTNASTEDHKALATIKVTAAHAQQSHPGQAQNYGEIAKILQTCENAPQPSANICKDTSSLSGKSYASCNGEGQVTAFVLVNCQSWDFASALDRVVANNEKLSFVSLVRTDLTKGSSIPTDSLSDRLVDELCKRRGARAYIYGQNLCGSE